MHVISRNWHKTNQIHHKDEETHVSAIYIAGGSEFHAQDRNPLWSLTARQNLEELGLNLNFDDVSKMSKGQFHAKASKAMSKLAFEYLLKDKFTNP